MTANVSNVKIEDMQVPIGINADSGTIDGNLKILHSLLDRFQWAGFSAVEIPVHGVGCILGGRLLQVQTDRVKRILERYPFLYTVHGPDPVNLCDEKNPELHASALRSSIDFAKAIGSPLVVYHGSYRLAEPERVEMEWVDEIERLKRIGEYAEKQGVTVAVENIFRQGNEHTYRIDPRLLAQVVGAVGSAKIGICFDFGHAFLSAQEEGFSYSEAVQAVLPRLVHVHVHDNLGIPMAFGPCENGMKPLDAFVLGKGDLHLPPGWGKVPYGNVLPDVVAAYKGVWMMEIHPRFSDAYEEGIQWLKDTITKNRRFIKP
ncbi:MAG: sugar phosphate isomerase/epimerase [Spirochaetes bacterium]|nr:sugar phosphate isomerase/epimerase [Spirochaetota bacterium]